MATIQREVRKRGFFGWLFLLLFWGFNVFMAFWLFTYWNELSKIDTLAAGVHTGVAIGGFIGTGAIAFFWVAGAVILGLFTLLTRGRRILITDDWNDEAAVDDADAESSKGDGDGGGSSAESKEM